MEGLSGEFDTMSSWALGLEVFIPTWAEPDKVNSKKQKT